MNRNYKLKWMFASSLARRIGWVGLIVMLGVGLFFPPLIRKSAGQGKVPPRTPQQEQKVEIEKKTNEQIKVNPALLRPGTLKGWVSYGNNGSPTSACTIRVRKVGAPAESNEWFAKPSARDSSYEVPNLAPGTYTVDLLCPNAGTSHTKVTIQAGKTTNKNLSPPKPKGMVKGRIEGYPPAAIVAHLTIKGLALTETGLGFEPNADGTFSSSEGSLWPQTYTIEMSGACANNFNVHFKTQTKTVSVGAGRPTIVNFTAPKTCGYWKGNKIVAYK